MNSKLKLTLKSIAHSGAHIGRDITLKVSSSELGNDIDKQAWENCYDTAGKILDGSIADPTSGADHYYSNSIKRPRYYKGKTPLLVITNLPDQHSEKITTYFYKLH